MYELVVLGPPRRDMKDQNCIHHHHYHQNKLSNSSRRKIAMARAFHFPLRMFFHKDTSEMIKQATWKSISIQKERMMTSCQQ